MSLIDYIKHKFKNKKAKKAQSQRQTEDNVAVVQKSGIIIFFDEHGQL